MSLDYEQRFYSDQIKLIVGVDEAGRGPLAGPVIAAAVIFPSNYRNDLINDSKQISDHQRRTLYQEIITNSLDYGIGIVDAETIDQINIYQAARLAMKIALSKIKIPYDMVITDAMPLPGFLTPVLALIKADEQVLCAAAASIIAKVTRDDMMLELDKQYPSYGFAKHKGYGTVLHLQAIEKLGPLKGIHRFTFRPIKTIKLDI
jgi:ribonuclease HII